MDRHVKQLRCEPELRVNRKIKSIKQKCMWHLQVRQNETFKPSCCCCCVCVCVCVGGLSVFNSFSVVCFWGFCVCFVVAFAVGTQNNRK